MAAISSVALQLFVFQNQLPKKHADLFLSDATIGRIDQHEEEDRTGWTSDTKTSKRIFETGQFSK